MLNSLLLFFAAWITQGCWIFRVWVDFRGNPQASRMMQAWDDQIQVLAEEFSALNCDLMKALCIIMWLTAWVACMLIMRIERPAPIWTWSTEHIYPWSSFSTWQCWHTMIGKIWTVWPRKALFSHCSNCFHRFKILLNDAWCRTSNSKMRTRIKTP